MSRKSVTRSDAGFTLVELLIVVGIIGVLAGLSAVQLLRARAAANEAASIGSLRSVTSGQFAYSSSCGQGGYASTLPTLGVPPPGSNVAFLSQDLTAAATIVKSGYQFTLGAGAGSNAGPADCMGTATTTGYYASSRPISFQITGNRSFAVSTQGVIWQDQAAVPPGEPFGAPATPVQ
jgi:prepilin-type N-terminal cleavage/methylation domain-containing protein